IIGYPESIVPVPQAPNYVLGLFSLRGEVLPLVSVAKLLGLKENEIRENTRIIVVQTKGGRVGFLTDYTREVMRIPKNIIAPPPSNFTQTESEQIKGIIKLNNGKRLIIYLKVNEMISTEVEGLLKEHQKKEETEMTGRGKNNVVMFVWFNVAEIEMAAPISLVKEVVNLENLYKVPKAPVFVEGIMNLRGEILPIVSTAKRLELSVKKNREGRVIVVQINNQQVGFIADEIKGILRLSSDVIFPPDNLPQLDRRFLEGIAKLEDGRLILLLNMSELLSIKEKEELKQLTQENKKGVSQTTKVEEENGKN
ncbi:MAG TPA: hypothetical protein ENF30_01715, partial [Candidatus Desulfofervidus auxilii]|nr:hypothetical protein [Candidatus Desulfofervidus auxilii]